MISDSPAAGQPRPAARPGWGSPLPVARGPRLCAPLVVPSAVGAARSPCLPPASAPAPVRLRACLGRAVSAASLGLASGLRLASGAGRRLLAVVGASFRPSHYISR